MKKISVYTDGGRDSINYYRIWQYVDKLKNVLIFERLSISENFYRKYSPVGYQSLPIKFVAWFLMSIRVLVFFTIDFFRKKDLIIVQRTFVKRKILILHKILVLLIIARGTKILWDFDDHIIESKEITKKDFNFISHYATYIIVTHDFLKNLIDVPYRNKVVKIPTTDGDMYEMFANNPEITKTRLELLKKELSVVWVATKGNLPNLDMIVPFLDSAARFLKEKKNLRLRLKVICNASLKCKTENLVVENIVWTRKGAIDEMKNAHIGIMPLIDSAFAKGKGGFKLVQYMSIGLPCIASDVGFNKFVVNDKFGFLVTTELEWVNAVEKLSNVDYWSSCSQNAFEWWKNVFSFKKNMDFFQMIVDSI